jgi:DNA-directed RNA polymerase specialized sigma24 family protein
MSHLLGEAMPRERAVQDETREGDFAYALGIGGTLARPRQPPRIEIREVAEIAIWHERPAEERAPVVCLHLAENSEMIQWHLWPPECLPRTVETYLDRHPGQVTQALIWIAGQAGVSWDTLMAAIGSGRWVLVFGLEAWFEVFLAEHFPSELQEWDRVWVEGLPMRLESVRLTSECEEFQCQLVDSGMDPELAGRLRHRLLLAGMRMSGSHPALKALRRAYPKARPDWVSLFWAARVAHGGEGENRWRRALTCLEKADLLYVQVHSREPPEREITDEMNRLLRLLPHNPVFGKAYRLLGDHPQPADREDLSAEARSAGLGKMDSYDLFRLRTKMSAYLVNAMAAAAFAWAKQRLTRQGREWDTAETAEEAAAIEAERQASATEARAELDQRLADSGLSEWHQRLVLAVGKQMAEGSSEREACEQVASGLGLAAEAVRKRYQRAVAELTKKINRAPRARPKTGGTRG